MTKRITVVRAPYGVDRDAFIARLVGADEAYVTDPDPRPATAIVIGSHAVDAIVLASYDVDDTVVWDEPIAGDVYSMFAFFRPPEGLDRDVFVGRYRKHAELARVHHPGIRRYVQDLVVDGSGAERWMFAAISELHFGGRDSYRDDFYTDEQSRDVIARDVQRFSDGATAKMIVGTRVVPG